MFWYQILLIVLGALTVFALVIFTLDAWQINRIVFDKRRDPRPYIPQFSGEQFGLKAKPVQFHFRKWKINGFIYSIGKVEATQKLIIFAHGLGPGHLPYMPEIAFLCREGYTVLAYDNIGCNLSQGKGTRGFYRGCQCLISAYRFAKKDAVLSQLPCFLVGHSWGGYSTLCAVSQVKVKAVVTFSAPLTPVKIITEDSVPYINKKSHPKARLRYIRFLSPFLWLVIVWRCGLKANMHSARSVSRSHTPALLFHGGADTRICPARSAALNAKGKNVQISIEEGKDHNPYATIAAGEKLKQLSKTLRALPNDEERKKYCQTFDFKAAYEDEPSVMQRMADFLKSH